MVNNRRSEFEIIADILSLSETGAKRTEILYKGYMSYSQLKQYLPYLLEKEILMETTIKNGHGYSKVYYTTDKGKELLVGINKIFSYLK